MAARSRRPSAAVRLPSVQVLILAGAWMCVFDECCVLSDVSVTARSFVQRIAAECGVSKARITRGYSSRYSPASERTESKLAMPITCGNA